MFSKYKREIIILSVSFCMCISIVGIIKLAFFKDKSLIEPIEKVEKYYNNSNAKQNYLEATTKKITTTTTVFATTTETEKTDEDEEDYQYYEAPEIEEDGSIIYDGLTITELTNKLNRSLPSYLTNTGYFFAEYTKKTGLNPYLSVAIVLLETGCNWQCSYIMVNCNNIGGLKGHGRCGNTGYSAYDSLEEGIVSYLDILYNGYMLKGLDTPEKMASTYAESPEWARKVNTYIEQIKAK